MAVVESDFGTPIAKAQIAAALAMLHDRNRADRVYTAALDAIAPKPTPALDRFIASPANRSTWTRSIGGDCLHAMRLPCV